MEPVLLRDCDIHIADQIIDIIERCGCFTREKLSIKDDMQYNRIVSVLQDKGYLKDAKTILYGTDNTVLYRQNGGAKSIYEKQQKEIKKEEYEYTNLKWVNMRAWLALIISIIALILQIA